MGQGLSASCYKSSSDCYKYMGELKRSYISEEFINLNPYDMREIDEKCCLVPDELRPISSLPSCEPYYSTVCEEIRKNIEIKFNLKLPNIWPNKFDNEIILEASKRFGTGSTFFCYLPLLFFSIFLMLIVRINFYSSGGKAAKPIKVLSRRAENLRRKKKCSFHAEKVHTGVSASGEIENVATPQLEIIASQLQYVARKVSYLSYKVENLHSQLDNLTSQLENVDGPVENLISQFENDCSQVENVARHFENVTSKFLNVGSQIENVAGKVGNVVSKFENVASQFENLVSQFENVAGKIENLVRKVENVASKVEYLTSKVENVATPEVENVYTVFFWGIIFFYFAIVYIVFLCYFFIFKSIFN